MVAYQMLQSEISDSGVATIVLNRPELGNRYNDLMLSEFARHLASFADNVSARLLVIKGAGRHFCVGADIGWHQASQSNVTDRDAPNLVNILQSLDHFPKPTLAVVHGACIGGGAALVACCDIVLAERHAFFSIPEVRLGLAATSLVPVFIRAIGHRQFRRYGLTAESFTADEAVRIGLAHSIYDASDMEERVHVVVDALMQGGPAAQVHTKALALQHALPKEPNNHSLENEFQAALQSPEAREGIASFVEKRRPVWYAHYLAVALRAKHEQ
jgi:methylglutaconyl-CoA hydratase